MPACSVVLVGHLVEMQTFCQSRPGSKLLQMLPDTADDKRLLYTCASILGKILI